MWEWLPVPAQPVQLQRRSRLRLPRNQSRLVRVAVFDRSARRHRGLLREEHRPRSGLQTFIRRVRVAQGEEAPIRIAVRARREVQGRENVGRQIGRPRRHGSRREQGGKDDEDQSADDA